MINAVDRLREDHCLVLEEIMPHWISEWILSIVTYVPALFVGEETPNFMLIRTMFGLVLITLVVFLVAMRPFRSFITSVVSKASTLVTRKH
jgi:hypothetical protein